MANLIKNLPAGEEVLCEAQRHWSRYARPSLVIILGLVIAFGFLILKNTLSTALDITDESTPKLIVAAGFGVTVVGYVWYLVIKQIDKGNRMIVTNNYIVQSDGRI
ncbi:MAG TPA: hypothetical protein VMF32_24615, partial [Xanthobacteraceae bacterium]|nr:hypothetical protein [Xanthobacteraceae bacterium]